jgi:hypothetical protein
MRVTRTDTRVPGKKKGIEERDTGVSYGSVMVVRVHLKHMKLLFNNTRAGQYQPVRERERERERERLR